MSFIFLLGFICGLSFAETNTYALIKRKLEERKAKIKNKE